jgi:hypothetical protein
MQQKYKKSIFPTNFFGRFIELPTNLKRRFIELPTNLALAPREKICGVLARFKLLN